MSRHLTSFVLRKRQICIRPKPHSSKTLLCQMGQGFLWHGAGCVCKGYSSQWKYFATKYTGPPDIMRVNQIMVADCKGATLLRTFLCHCLRSLWFSTVVPVVSRHGTAPPWERPGFAAQLLAQGSLGTSFLGRHWVTRRGSSPSSPSKV